MGETQAFLSPSHSYLRLGKRFPSVWCSGCGIGIVMGAMIRAIDRLGISKDEVVVVSGIGCSSRLPGYVDFNTLHTAHGRALAYATGVKLVKPGLKVIVVMGDGDALAIGGNHFIHAARRNMDLTAIVINNFIYGMTGGQCSPTTPQGKVATTAPYGCVERGFDIPRMSIAAGAVFVARGTAYHAMALDRLIEKALRKKGFSVVEAVSHCHTLFGRLNRQGTAVQMLEWQRDHAVPVSTAAKLKPEQLEGKLVTGVLWDTEAPDYLEIYRGVEQAALKVTAEMRKAEEAREEKITGEL
jgi:2-oxoglutarate ferredoxin oxidoreductase subunit beta